MLCNMFIRIKYYLCIGKYEKIGLGVFYESLLLQRRSIKQEEL